MKKFYLFTASFLLGNIILFSQAVGIGDVVFTPNYLLHVHQNAASGVVAQFTNTSTGNTTTDGFQINLNGSNVELINRENAGMRFFTNNTERARITNTGNVGIGTTTPSEILDVAGNIKFSGALMPGGNAGTTDKILLSQGPATAPAWSNFFIGNPSSITQIGKYFVNLSWTGNWNNNTAMTFTVTDPDCTANSQISANIATNTWNALFAGLTIRNIVALPGQFRITIVNNTGSNLTGALPIVFSAFY